MILCVCPNPSIDSYAWLDTLKPGKANRITRLNEYPGGKGIHVAMAINEICGTASVHGFWGGAAGSLIRKMCFENNVLCFGPEINGANRKCFTFRSDPAHPTWDHTELLEPGPVISNVEYEQFLDCFKAFSTKAQLICLSGSWPAGAPLFAYQELINIANANNKRVILDASGVQLEFALKASPFGLHVNWDEARELCGTDDLGAIMKFLSQYVELIALTKGKEGLYLMYQGKLLHANVQIDRVISAVGSGDCLTAGIAFAVRKNLPAPEIAKWGVACGAANCLREDLGMLHKKDVLKLFNQAYIKEISL